ncbi:zinc finger CCCH domain-containing protein 7B isoform X3 [Crotalus tigris]|uniref:zinc finger CCCH domain-containing protein 7B isoform X3 n=1 Tax=Crotalus tigris TaxID=88082 RepID=UPI00192F1C3B|nr:zinc finger CCCH domain-containing protein 7B isoform X3 [Crotalus tigris]
MERQKRKEEIEKGLQFIQSTLPLNQEDYEAFLQKLVQNLLAEGNDLFREKDYKLALVQYIEGLNVSEYAASDEVNIPADLLCKLHVNRAACYFAMGLHEKALEDSEKALGFNKENIRALFRKARCLSELGRHKEAYECNSRCLLSLPHDESVVQLGQDLAQKLGLRVRKAYKRPQQDSETFCVLSNGLTSALPNQTNGLGSIDDIETDNSVVLQCIVIPSGPSVTASKANAFSSTDLETKSLPRSLLATTLLSSADVASIPESDSIDDFTEGEVLGDELDSILDSIADGSQYPLSLVRGAIPANLPSEVPQLIPVFPGGTPLLPPVVTASIPVSTPLPPASFGLVMEATKQLSSSSVLDTFETPVGGSGTSPLDSLDSLDLLPYTESRLDMLDAFGTSRGSLDALDTFTVEETSTQEPRQPAGIQKSLPVANQTGSSTHTTVPKVVELLMSQPELVMSNTTLLVKNPLVSTHIFKQVPKLVIILIEKVWNISASETYCWVGVVYPKIKHGREFAHVQPRQTLWDPIIYAKEEIDVWTEERKGTLNRDLLFDPLGGIKRGNLTITKILKEHQGIFIFLCEICFDSKPRIISKGLKDSPAVCSNLAAKHNFYDNKCLVHIVRSTSLKYSKIRQFQEHFQFDVCRHEVRYGCLREDSCHFAHSFIELKVWLLQQYSGMTHEDIVQESKKYWQQMEAHASKANNNMASVRTPISNTFDLQMKFVCGQCWRNGQVVEPDKDLKYCSAKAHHCWTKERRVLLVMSKAKKKWVSVRPLPSIRNFPQQYDLCIHAQNGRKCQYVGNCSFAHSPEEREMWTFMKENKILDMQQTYDMWLKKHNPGKPGEGTPLTSREGEKQIQMPTDYADMMGYHCWLCGKNSNSKKQWQQHIQSEKHKEKVFTSDNDSSCWNYRFPMGEFRLCERFQKTKGCPEGEKCHFAHGQDELTEWLDRREVMKQKLAKARKDMLLCPRDDDFGKYNFLLRDSI